MAFNTAGYVFSTDPYKFAEGQDAGPGLTVAKLTLYNPNATAAAFVIRLVVTTETESEAPFIRYDDEIPATGTWEFGGTMDRMTVLPGQRYELVLDSAPSLGIHVVCDIAQ